MRFLTLSSKAEQYYQMLEQRRMNPHHHVQKIVALSEIYGPEAVSRAIDDAFTFKAFSCESNVIFLGGVGLGKTHLASALGYGACLKGNTVLFATAIDITNMALW